MKRFSLLAFGLVISMFLISCESILIYNSELPPIKSPEGKALCVVYRPMAITGNDFVPVFLDGKYVGGTEGNTMLTIPVDPGEHYIIGDGTNKSKCRFTFQTGKIYFIRHTVVTITQRAGPITIRIVTSTFKPKTGEDAMQTIEEEKGKMRWVQPNPNKPQEDLSQKDFDEVKEDYEEWAADEENAEDFAVERDYPGY